MSVSLSRLPWQTLFFYKQQFWRENRLHPNSEASEISYISKWSFLPLSTRSWRHSSTSIIVVTTTEKPIRAHFLSSSVSNPRLSNLSRHSIMSNYGTKPASYLLCQVPTCTSNVRSFLCSDHIFLSCFSETQNTFV